MNRSRVQIHTIYPRVRSDRFSILLDVVLYTTYFHNNGICILLCPKGTVNKPFFAPICRFWSDFSIAAHHLWVSFSPNPLSILSLSLRDSLQFIAVPLVSSMPISSWFKGFSTKQSLMVSFHALYIAHFWVVFRLRYRFFYWNYCCRA